MCYGYTKAITLVKPEWYLLSVHDLIFFFGIITILIDFAFVTNT